MRPAVCLTEGGQGHRASSCLTQSCAMTPLDLVLLLVWWWNWEQIEDSGKSLPKAPDSRPQGLPNAASLSCVAILESGAFGKLPAWVPFPKLKSVSILLYALPLTPHLY